MQFVKDAMPFEVLQTATRDCSFLDIEPSRKSHVVVDGFVCSVVIVGVDLLVDS